MLHKVTPSNVIMIGFGSWIIYQLLFDPRKHRVWEMGLDPCYTYAHQIEREKLGRIYRPGEHLTKSMFGDTS